MSEDNNGDVKLELLGETDAPGKQSMTDLLVASGGIYMKQKASLTEAATQGMCEKANKYKLYDQTSGKKLYTAKEKSNCFGRMCCAPNHSAVLKIKEDDGPVAYTAYKPFAFTCCCAICGICQPEIQVYKGEWDPDKPDEGGELLGTAKAPTCGGVVTPKLDIFDKDHAPTGSMTGPMCCIGSCCDTKFTYKNTKDEEKGHIAKVVKKDAKGAAQEMFTDADNFGLEFDPSMNEAQRATMIGVMLLLDFWFFEEDGACELKSNKCSVKFFDWYCCGCKIPCKISCGGDKKEDE